MNTSSIVLLSGANKIYQRLLGQIPQEILRAIDTNLVRPHFLVKNDQLIAEILVDDKKYQIQLVALSDSNILTWRPHPNVDHKNEIAFINEVLSEFRKIQFISGASLANRDAELTKTCESFFREVYR